MTAAVVVAGGSGRRMGFDKVLAPLAGRPVVVHSVAAFEAAPEVAAVVVVAAAGSVGRVRELMVQAGFTKVVDVVAGGAERHDSVFHGLEALGDGIDVVVVHDAARPLVTPAAIGRCLAAAAEHGAAALAHRVADTLKAAGPDRVVTGSVDREGLWAMETPQAFERELLAAAYGRLRQAGGAVTDEVSAVQMAGVTVRLVENPEPNPKLTVPGDVLVAEAILAARAAGPGGAGR